MQVLVIAVVLLGVAYGRPGVAELSGSYLPGTSGGSSILSTGIGGSSLAGLGGLSGGLSGLGGAIGGLNGGISGLSSGISGLSSGIGGFGGGIGGISSSVGVGYNTDVNVQRHVYFYTAPDDEVPATLRVNIAPAAARNTKIIFIKAPSSGGVIPEVNAPPSLSEDKTLVYVLLKKQEQGGQINIPSSLGVKQAKPEVYFIKYRNPQEAEQVVAAGVSGQAVGNGLHDLGDQSSFVRTLSYGGVSGISNGGILGGSGLSSGGASVLSGGVAGDATGVLSNSGSSGIRYGAPGASGPYKR